MGVSKVVYNTENGQEVLMDLTNDTVAPASLAKGATAHDASGNLIVGTATPVNIVQTTGQSETDIMSQKAVTEELSQLSEEIVDQQTQIEVERARIDSFTKLGEGSTTGDAELIDARTDCEGKTWTNAGGHIRGITKKIIDACCDKVIEGAENYNLLKANECTFNSRLQDDSTELIESNYRNFVTGWIPVEYGKYYTASRELNGVRVTQNGESASGLLTRINVKKADGSIEARGKSGTSVDTTIAGSLGVKPASSSTIQIKESDIVAIRLHLNLSDGDVSTAELVKSNKFMITSADTHEASVEKAKNSAYMDGDEQGTFEVSYVMKSDDSKADKTAVETLSKEVETLKQSSQNSVLVNASCDYDGNYIPNERFIRSIANLRDSENAKDFDITITNNSGAIIKNATIVVGLHNAVGVDSSRNNLPFQIYDDMFSEPVGFKFFDGETELPYYIESESDCNYIVDENVWTSVKTLAVFSDGKIARYNSTVARMQISADDGNTWANICNEITSSPHRILLPDSQNNLFVASSDGYKLYKYTSADGYMTGTQVIDMEADETQIGSILAEDADGNLYLGTYQSEPWHCVIRKSTNHGDTWSIVFDTTASQHVHNIYVNKNVTPNEIFIGLDNYSGSVETYVSTDAGGTWAKINVPYRNGDYAFRYAGENFYIGCGERNILGGVSLYKTSDYNDAEAYYTLFDNCQGIRDIMNVIEGSDDVLIAGGCVDDAVQTQHLFLSEDRGETWKTVFMNPHYANVAPAGAGLRTFSRKGTQILSETYMGYAMRFVYGNGAKTTLAVVHVGDVPTDGKTITLKTGYVANIEQMDRVLTAYEQIDGKVADIEICDGYVIDRVSNKRVMTTDTELCNSGIRIGQTSECKYLANHAYKLNGSVNLGKLSRLNFTKGFTVSFLFRKEDGKNYLADDKYHVIFQTGDTKLILWYRSLVLMSGDTNIFAKKLYLEDAYLNSEWGDYLRITAYFTNDDLPVARIYTNNTKSSSDATCTEYSITESFSDNDFIVGSSDMPNIARVEIYNRVLTHGEILSLTNGCNLITDKSQFN